MLVPVSGMAILASVELSGEPTQEIHQTDTCLVSEIFSFFHVFMSDFACNRRRSAAVLEHLVHQDYHRRIV